MSRSWIRQHSDVWFKLWAFLMHQFSQFIKPIWMILMTESDFSSWFAWLLDLVTEVNSLLGGVGWGYHWKNSHEAIIRLHKNVVHAAYRPILWCFYHAFSFNLSFSSSQMQLNEWPVQFKILLLCSTEESNSGFEWHESEYIMTEFYFIGWTIALNHRSLVFLPLWVS